MIKQVSMVALALIAFATTQAHSQYSSNSGDITLIITHGQSLSIGVSSTSSASVSNSAEYQNEALTLDSGNATRNSIGWQAVAVNPNLITRFAPLIQSSTFNESPDSGVLSAILDSFDAKKIARPTLLSISGGHGGRSVAELSVKSSDFYSSVSAGLAGTQNLAPFYIKNSSGKYEYYIKNNGAAVKIGLNSTAGTINPVYYNNILEQVKKAVILAKQSNRQINPNVYFIWIQGQADASNRNYKPLLKELLRRMEADLRVATGLGSNMHFDSFMSQLRGSGNKDRAIDQIEVANEVANSHFGAQESWISNGLSLGAPNGTHLQKVGYRVLGEQLGHSIFQVMMSKQEVVPAITSVAVNGTLLTVSFGGLRGSLVADNSVHQSVGIPVPPNFGFYLYTSTGYTVTNNSIVSSRILGGNKVELTLSKSLTGSVYLYLGRNPTRVNPTNAGSVHAGTTLRDSVQDKFVGSSRAAGTFLGQSIPRYAPIQRVLVDKTQPSYQGYMGLVTPSP